MQPTLARLGEDYVAAHYGADPFEATVSGVAGFDAEVPDPSRAAAETLRSRLAAVASVLDRVDPGSLAPTDHGAGKAR